MLLAQAMSVITTTTTNSLSFSVANKEILIIERIKASIKVSHSL
jgi:hypothetical protein